MRKRYTWTSTSCELRDTPASDYEIARITRHREAGTSPGNPKWYKPLRVRAYSFEHGQPAQVPAWTRSKLMEPQVLAIPALTQYIPGKDTRELTPAEYVEDFDKLNNLKPCTVQWIKVPDGNYT